MAPIAATKGSYKGPVQNVSQLGRVRTTASADLTTRGNSGNRAREADD
ncbi:hypothetical protein ACFWZ3_12265 [Frateuria sp. GZRR35]